jgi:6,7-dimethyl-8-ribityllumazine synthase
MRSIDDQPSHVSPPVQHGARVLIVVSTYYDDIASSLLEGAWAVCKDAYCQVTTLKVPGALEVPIMIAIALECAEKQGSPYHAVVALGCVIRGETSHYDIVVRESARALMDLAVMQSIPLGNGILTVETHEQAQIRAARNSVYGQQGGNLGGWATQAALALYTHKMGLLRDSVGVGSL